ncbi:hypothetical protein D3C76_1833130 [compost metagenome]
MWFQMTSSPFFGMGKGTAVSKLVRPLPPVIMVVVVAFFFAAANTASGTVAVRRVWKTGIT